MDSKRIKALLMAGVTLFVSGCSAISESGYVGYMKNEVKFGKGVTRQFQQAVARANIEWLDEILTEYPEYNINYYDKTDDGYSGYDYETLKVIVSSFHMNVTYMDTYILLDYLLKKGLNPNIKFSNGHYALDWLCADYKDKPYLVKAILENGADPNNANSAGFYNMDLGESKKTTLYLPIYWGIYTPMYTNAEDLLNHGAEVSYEILDNVHGNRIEGSAKPYQLAFKSYMEKTGESPFTKVEEYAILGESNKLIEELKNGEKLDKDAALNVINFICRFCNSDTVKAWNEVYSSEIKNINKEYLLNIAAYEGNYEVFKYLYDESINGIKDLTINNSLNCAAQAGSYDICKFLLENGSLKENTSCAELLISAYQSENFDTFKLLAKFFSDNEMLAEIDMYNVFENIPIKWNDYNRKVIDCLMDECGLTLQLFPIIDTDFQTVDYLFKKGKPLSVLDLPSAIISHDSETVKLVLDMGADPNQYSYRTNLMQRNHIKELMMPYDEFMKWDKINNIEKGESSLHLSVVFGTSEIVKLLVEYGMNIDDDMALYMAIKDSSKATFDVLFNAGASLDYRDDEEKETLVDAAKSMGRNDIVKILRKAGVKGYGGF